MLTAPTGYLEFDVFVLIENDIVDSVEKDVRVALINEFLASTLTVKGRTQTDPSE